MFHIASMDQTAAIERHRDALLLIVASLYTLIGLAEGGIIERLSSSLHHKVLILLRPAEAAVRRLIIAAAQGLVVKARGSRPFPKGRVIAGKRQGRLSFPLFDPPPPRDRRRRSGANRVVPRIRSLEIGFGPLIPPFLRPAPPQPEPEPEPERKDGVNAVPLSRRLAAIMRALKDLPAQARRYARLKAKLEAAQPLKRRAILRRGPPPSLDRNSTHEVHEILRDCHWLAHTALKPNTS
jgi:hypothetical protein